MIVLCSHGLNVLSWRAKEDDRLSAARLRRIQSGLPGLLWFSLVTGILAVVGSRVASLVVLEFSLRAVSGLVTAGQVR